MRSGGSAGAGDVGASAAVTDVSSGGGTEGGRGSSCFCTLRWMNQQQIQVLAKVARLFTARR